MKNQKKYYIFINLVVLIFFIVLYYVYVNYNNVDADKKYNNNNIIKNIDSTDTWNIDINNNSSTGEINSWTINENTWDNLIIDVDNKELPSECISKKGKKEFSNIFYNYKLYKEFFLSWSIKNEYNKEFNAIKSFSLKDCSYIDKNKDAYTFSLCSIFVTWDYSKLDNFNFLEWETKERTILLFNSINSKELSDKLNNNEKNLFYSITNFEKNKTTADFKLQEKPEQFRWDIYTYMVENWEIKFLQQLENSLKSECKKL